MWQICVAQEGKDKGSSFPTQKLWQTSRAEGRKEEGKEKTRKMERKKERRKAGKKRGTN
jgi:hypothetical protein